MECATLGQLEVGLAARRRETNRGRPHGADGLQQDDEKQHREHRGGEGNDELAGAARASEADEVVTLGAPVVVATELNDDAKDEAADK